MIDLLEIIPEKLNRNNQTEHFSLEKECPLCRGKGYLDYSGYNQKFKEETEDADFIKCSRCEGSQKLVANITIEWLPLCNSSLLQCRQLKKE